ncbi:MAG TPA: response regulator [Rubricoccaceae bacterium]|nr:response regulator [Rubricoccaceae bacterium]
MISLRMHGRPVEILLVEDSPGDVQLTVEALRDAKVSTHLHVATDGEEALAFLRRAAGFEDAPRPDLILLDLNLPKKSGHEVLEEVKTDPELRRIPVVILSTSDAEDDVIAAYDRSANCYVTKPVDLDRFWEVVHSIDQFWLSFAKLPSAAES